MEAPKGKMVSPASEATYLEGIGTALKLLPRKRGSLAWPLATKRTGAHFSLPLSVLLLAKLSWKIVNKIL